MNKNNLISLLILDAIVMLLSVGLIFYRYSSLGKLVGLETEKPLIVQARQEPKAEHTPVQATAQNKETPNIKNETKKADMRNIRFTFKHSKAKKVEIIGDFNGWVPEPFVKDASGKTWQKDIQLEPGEYAYNFVVDGKPVRDPNNKKTCNVGRGFVNSQLTVKPR